LRVSSWKFWDMSIVLECTTIPFRRCLSSCRYRDFQRTMTEQLIGTIFSQLVGLTIGPAFLSAAIYLCLGRIIVVYGQHISRLKPRSYTIIFMTCDGISLILQSAGGAITSMADTQKDKDLGVNIMIAGLISQVISLTVFAGLCADFMMQVRKRWTEQDIRFFALRQSWLWKAFLAGKLSAFRSLAPQAGKLTRHSSRAYNCHGDNLYTVLLSCCRAMGRLRQCFSE
jgi:hypothetical protein